MCAPTRVLVSFAGVVVAGALACVGAVAPVLAAPAGFPAPAGLRATNAASTTIAFAWTAVPGAPAYRLKISSKSSMKKGTDFVTTKPSVAATGLKPATRYYATVRVVSTTGEKLGAKSGVIQAATTGASTPTPAPSPTPSPNPSPAPTGPAKPPAGFRVTAVNSRGVALDWADQRGAAGYRVQLAKTPAMTDAVELPFTSSAASIHGLMNKRTYYAQVRGVDASGRSLGGWSGRLAIAVPAAPAAPKKPALTIASYNIRCANCYSHQNEEKPWESRRAAVVAQIISRAPDVIGIQEASQGKLKGSSLSQFDDLRARLRSAGIPYEITNSFRYNCRTSTSSSSCKYQDRSASQGTRIFFNTNTVSLVSQWSKALPSCSGCNTRYVAWAIFKQKATGQQFFVAETQTQFMAKYASLRHQEMKVMMDEVGRRNPAKLPAFVMGDFNSTRYQAPTNAPYDEVIQRGFVDPLGHTAKSPVVSALASAETRIRANYNSHNSFLRTVAKFAEWQNGSNLDYILTTPMRVLVWETVLDIDSRDRIVGIIPSDHNMVLVKAVLP